MTDDAGSGKAASDELRNSFALRSAAAAVGLVATLLTTVIGVRFLDAREAAVLLAILAGLMLGPMFGKLGLGQNVIRLVASERDPRKRRLTIGAHLRATLLLALLSAPLLAAASTAGLLGHPDHLPALVLTAVLLVAETLRLMLSDVFAALGAVRVSVATTHHVRSVVVLLPLVLLVLVSPRLTLLAVLAVYTGVAVLLLAGALVRVRHDFSLTGRSAATRLVPTIITGLVLFVLDASVFVVGRGDVWLASAAFAPFDAARYGTVSMLAYQVTVLYGLASLAVTPAAARLLAAHGRDPVLRLLSAASTLVTAATAMIVLCLVIVGRPALAVAYGPQFADSYWLLVVLAVGGLGQAVFGFSVPLLLLGGQIRRAVTASVVVLAVMVPITVVVALWLGPAALAVASGVSALALPAAQWWTARRAFGQAPLPSLRLREALVLIRSSAPRATPAQHT